jgi:hypothetical protein
MPQTVASIHSDYSAPSSFVQTLTASVFSLVGCEPNRTRHSIFQRPAAASAKDVTKKGERDGPSNVLTGHGSTADGGTNSALGRCKGKGLRQRSVKTALAE